jgi:hypothetical protein
MKRLYPQIEERARACIPVTPPVHAVKFRLNNCCTT